MIDRELVELLDRAAEHLKSSVNEVEALKKQNALLKSDWVTLDEVADQLKVEKRFVERFLKGLKVFKSGNKVVRYKRTDVEERIQKNLTNAT